MLNQDRGVENGSQVGSVLWSTALSTSRWKFRSRGVSRMIRSTSAQGTQVRRWLAGTRSATARPDTVMRNEAPRATSASTRLIELRSSRNGISGRSYPGARFRSRRPERCGADVPFGRCARRRIAICYDCSTLSNALAGSAPRHSLRCTTGVRSSRTTGRTPRRRSSQRKVRGCRSGRGARRRPVPAP